MKTIGVVAFCLTLLAHWAVPANMIWQNEQVLSKGKLYKFRTAPVDPNDPFRGKYITLWLNPMLWAPADTAGWKPGFDVHIALTTDSAGFATPKYMSMDKPGDTEDYFSTPLTALVTHPKWMLEVELPFNRFYMDEFMAGAAEERYRQSFGEDSASAWAAVRVWRGRAVLEDVFIEGQSVRQLVAPKQE